MKAFRIVIQFHQFEIYIKLIAKTRYTGTVHLATEPLRQLRLDGGLQSWLKGILKTTNFHLLYCQLSLQVLNLGLQLCNQSPKVYSRIRSRHCAAGSTALYTHTMMVGRAGLEAFHKPQISACSTANWFYRFYTWACNYAIMAPRSTSGAGADIVLWAQQHFTLTQRQSYGHAN